MGSFDAKLRSEQQAIANERDARQVSVRTVAMSDSGNGSGADDPPGDKNAREGDRRRGDGKASRPGDLKSDNAAGTDSPRNGGLQSDRSGGNANVAGNGATAKEIPDGNDDDVVARRLRKAAEQETDPELKDKLWKEYVEYKKNMQGK
jgi:hypothetical protein